MKEMLKELVSVNAAPLAFLIVAGSLCLFLPEGKQAEAIYLVIGAALTRVKRPK